MTAPAVLIARLTASGYRLRLRPDGGVRIEPTPPADLLAELRRRRDEIQGELRRRASVPTVTDTADHAGELAACCREGELLVRVRTGLGDEIDATLWRVLDRVLDARDLALADQLWQHVLDADRRGIYSRLVGWLRSLDHAGHDLHRVRALVETGPVAHPHHDQGAA